MAIEVDLTTTTDASGEGVLDVEHPEYIEDLTPRGATRGLAELDAYDRVRKNPEPVKGQVYLLWNTIDDDHHATFIVTCVDFVPDGDRTVPVFLPIGYIARPASDDAPMQITHTASMYIEDANRVWVKARFAPVSPTQEQINLALDSVPALRDELAQEQRKFEKFGEDLNELAENNGWCESYDTIVQELGLPGREKNYWVEVQAEVTITDNSPSSDLDQRLEREYGTAIDTSYLEIRGKVTVRVPGITASSAEAAQASIDRDNVQEELDSVFSGADVELSEWEVTNSGQED